MSLLNQLADGQHLTRQLWSPPDVGVHKPSQRVTEGERPRFGHGQSKFIYSYESQYDNQKENPIFLGLAWSDNYVL